MHLIETIDDYQQLDEDQKVHLLKSLLVKKRLDVYLNQRKKVRDFEPYYRPCEHCHGGAKLIEPRDDSGIHPSGVAGCLQALWYSAADYVYQECDFCGQAVDKFDARMQVLFDWGTALHRTFQGYGLDGAWCDPSHYHQEAPLDPETNQVAADLWIKGHADARIDSYVVNNVPTIGDVSVRMIHEYKSMKQEKFDRQMSPKPEHKWQATVYAGVLDVPIVVYLYVGKNTSEVHDYPVGFDPNLWDQIVRKIRHVQNLVNKYVRPHTKRTFAGQNDKKYECRQCRFYNLCTHPDKSAKQSRRKARF